MHARAMVLLTLLSSAGSLVLTASFAEGPSPKSVPTYKVVAGWPEPSGPIKLGQVSAVATDASDRVFVFHRGEPPVVVFDRDGKYLRSWGEGLVKKAHGLRIDREQNVWTTDVGHHLVRKFDHEGNAPDDPGPARRAGHGPDRFNQPTDVAVTPSGEFYVSDGYGNSRVVKFSKDGRYLKEWGKKGKGEGEFNLPHAICLDAGGPDLRGRPRERPHPGFRRPRASSSPSGRRRVRLRPLPHRRPPPPRGRRPGQPRDRPRPQRQGAQHWGEPGAGPGQFAMPHAVCVDSRGDVYVAEIDGRRLQKFTAK